LRVLFVNRMLCLERGGGETFDLEISRVLRERFGVEVEYLSGAPLCGRAPKALAGATCLHTPWLRRFPWDRVKGGWRVRQAEFEWFERRAARWIAEREGRWDVIQVCELPELVHWLKAKGAKTPVVMRMTAPNYYDRLGGAGEADALVASGMSIETMRARGVEAADVPNAVDTERFRPAGPEEKAAARREWGIGEDVFVVVYPARLQGFKDHRTLLSAWAGVVRAVEGAVLLLAGDGPLREPLETQAAELGLGKSVRFLGEVPNERLPGLLRAADAGVISSEYESFCFAAIEMMATGLPVATTDCGWVPRLVEDGAGLIVPVKGTAELAGALEKLAGNEALRTRMGATARHLAETRHTWPASAEKLLAVYRKVLGPFQPEKSR
jgi:glycosyltransferase involved in cell wall biosynthesis